MTSKRLAFSGSHGSNASPDPIEPVGKLRTRARDGCPSHLVHYGSPVSGPQNTAGPLCSRPPKLREGRERCLLPACTWEAGQGTWRHLWHVAGILQRCQGTNTHSSLTPGKESGVGDSPQRRCRHQGCGSRDWEAVCHPDSGQHALTFLSELSLELSIQVPASRIEGSTELPR